MIISLMFKPVQSRGFTPSQQIAGKFVFAGMAQPFKLRATLEKNGTLTRNKALTWLRKFLIVDTRTVRSSRTHSEIAWH